MKKIEHFIGGNFTSITSKKTSLVYNPATGENIAEVSLEMKVVSIKPSSLQKLLFKNGQ